jgi:hypothetical protein
MLGSIWAFLTDPGNRAVFSRLGGGIVIFAGGIWAVVKLLAKREGDGGSKPSVTAAHRSVADGGSAINSPINSDPEGRRKR